MSEFFGDDPRFPELKSTYSAEYARFTKGLSSNNFETRKHHYTAMDAVVTTLRSKPEALKRFLDPEYQCFFYTRRDTQYESITPFTIMREGDLVKIHCSSSFKTCGLPTKEWYNVVKYRGSRAFGGTNLIKWDLIDAYMVDSDDPDEETNAIKANQYFRDKVVKDLAVSLLDPIYWMHGFTTQIYWGTGAPYPSLD